MTRSPLRLALAAAVASFALVTAVSAPASAAPSRAELEQSVISLENQLAEALTRLRNIEEATGGGAAGSLQEQLVATQTELARVVGELEESRYQSGRLYDALMTLRREIQLRDAEIAEKLGLEPAFVAIPAPDLNYRGGAADNLNRTPNADPFANPFLDAEAGAEGAVPGQAEPPLGAPAGAPGEGAVSETDPTFFGEDPFAQARAAASGQLGVRAPLPDDPAAALEAAKRLLIDGRFDEAEAAFAEFQQRFADTPQVAEAYYWQGESRFLREDYEQAKDLYIASLRADAAHPRAPDALIQLASSLQNLNLMNDACSTLSSFPTQYPNAALSVRNKAERVRQAAGCR